MSELTDAIDKINASAAATTRTTTFFDEVGTASDSTIVTNPNNGKQTPSIKKQVKDQVTPELQKFEGEHNAQMDKFDKEFYEQAQYKPAIPWAATTPVSDKFQLYSESTNRYRPNPSKIPFTTGATINDDIANDLWITYAEATLDQVNTIANAGDSQLAGGKIWPVENRSAENGDNIQAPYTRIKDKDGNTLFSWHPVAYGVLSSLSFSSRTAEIGGVPVTLRSLGPGNVKYTSQYGVVGDYDPVAKTGGTNDTKGMQALFNSIEDGDTIHLDSPSILLDRDAADIISVDGINSYICVVQGKKNVKLTGPGVIHQPYNQLDTVGVCFKSCPDLHLDMPVLDGNFRYTETTPITYKQMLIHLIDNDRMKGGFTVKNSSNYGFLITNQYAEGSGYVNGGINNSVLHTVISENCLQNSTFGTGINAVVINSFMCINPITSPLKASSRIKLGETDSLFDGLRLNYFSCKFDETYKVPLKSDGSAPNNYMSILDNVSQVQNLSVGYADVDMKNCPIAGSIVKQHPRDKTYANIPNGPVNFEQLHIRNHNVQFSTIYDGDNEATNFNAGEMHLYDCKSAINIQNSVDSFVQPRNKKRFTVNKIVMHGDCRVGVNVNDLTADLFNVKEFIQDGQTDLQSINISNTCDITEIKFPDLNISGNVSINGTFETCVLKGKVDCSNKTSDPISVNSKSKAGKLDFAVDVIGDGDVNRKIYLNNVSTIKVGEHSFNNVSLGCRVFNFDQFLIADTSPTYSGLGAGILQPWDFDSATSGEVFGTFSHVGSPNDTLLASASAEYKRKDGSGATVKYYKTMNDDGGNKKLGWRNPAYS